MALFIPLERITFKSSRSSGPGGQSVNKTESKVELRFSIADADWIPTATLHRLKQLFANKINSEGELVISSEEHRSRKQNHEACLQKLKHMLAEAQKVPKRRVKTKATRASQLRRVDSKKKRSTVKKNRSKSFSSGD